MKNKVINYLSYFIIFLIISFLFLFFSYYIPSFNKINKDPLSLEVKYYLKFGNVNNFITLYCEYYKIKGDTFYLYDKNDNIINQVIMSAYQMCIIGLNKTADIEDYKER